MGAELVEFVENQLNGRPHLLVGIENNLAAGELDVPTRDGADQFASVGLVKLAALQAISHCDELIFTHRSFQPQEKSIVRISRLVEAVLIREQCTEDRTHVEKTIPVLVGASQSAHLNPQDQTDVPHGNLSQQAVKSIAILGRRTTESLVVVDHENTVLGPSESHCIVDQRVLAFT